MPATNEIKMDVKCVLDRTEGDGPRMDIRIVSWNDRAPVLEKRQIIKLKDTGEERTGRNRGFTATEFEMLTARSEEILLLFEKHDPTFTRNQGKG